MLVQCNPALSHVQASGPAAVLPHKPVDTSAQAIEDTMHALSTNPQLAEAFVCTSWPLAHTLVEQGVITLLLELVHSAPGEER